MTPEKLDGYIKRMKLEHSLISYRNKLKVGEERPKCKTRYYKTLRGKHKQNTPWHKWQKYFLDPSPRVMKIKVKINKWGPIKLKSFATVKQTIQKWKDNLRPGRKYLQMMQPTKDCFPKYINTKAHTAQYLKNKQHNQKLGRRLKQTFLQRRPTGRQQAHEKMLSIANYQRRRITAHGSERPSSESWQIINARQTVEKRQPFNTVVGNANWCSHYGEKYGSSFKN